MRRTALLILCVVTGCAPTVIYTATNPLTPRAAGTVEVHTVQPPDRPFVDVGYFEIEDPALSQGNPRSSEVVARARAEGGRRGCDSLVIEGPNHVSQGLYNADRCVATCIVYR